MKYAMDVLEIKYLHKKKNPENLQIYYNFMYRLAIKSLLNRSHGLKKLKPK